MNILVVDDETNIRKALSLCLQADGHKVVGVSNPSDARSEAGRRAFDMAFVDLRLGAEKGMELIPQLLAESPWLKVVVITAYASVDTAVQSMKIGSTDYLAKPFTPAQVKQMAQRVAQVRQMERKASALRESVQQLGPEADIDKTTHPGMQKALHLARQVASTDATVLIRGESGTGKSALARAVHAWSNRRDKPLSVVACPAYINGPLDEELFGRVESTGEETLGRVAVAEGGTVLLDEIGDVPLHVQSKLLRFVRDREYEPSGKMGVRRADVRLVTSTSKDLGALAAAGRFREDLLYRLNVIQIELPPLRERTGDILPMAESYLAYFAARGGGKPLAFSQAAADVLKRYSWPGNIHELRNVVERCAILATGETVEVEHLPPAMTAQPVKPAEPGELISLDQLEELHIRRVLAATRSLEEAAGVLGIDTATLWRRRKKYRI